MNIITITIILAGMIPFIYHDYIVAKSAKERIGKEKYADDTTLADGIVIR